MTAGPLPQRGATAIVPVILLVMWFLVPARTALAQGFPVPALCPGGQNPIGTLFFDDLENTGSGNWAISAVAGALTHWHYPPPPSAIFPASGVMNLWARDDPDIGDSTIAMTRSFAIPPGARLQFNHAYVFESDGIHHFDGGVIEYSTTGGASWIDAGSLIVSGATYDGTINANFSNPLGGRSAFVNDSLGYTASQLDLASLTGQSVRFRFRIGTDETLEDTGWFIDDVRLYQCPGGTPGSRFTDVSPGSAFFPWIEAVAASGITAGCATAPPQYCPDAVVTRGQMAVFLLRGIHGAGYQPPPVTGTQFEDVSGVHSFAAWIEQLADEGITAGCAVNPARYCPELGVTRGEMAVFLLRSRHGAGYQPPAATGLFTDVPPDHPFVRWIEQLAREGITSGCGAGVYCAGTYVTRAQMAVFLVRTFNLPM